ncbi:phage late control D family protein [Paenibacillus sp. strain BS8-2]
MPTYKMSDLEEKYYNFVAPEFEIIIEGHSAKLDEMAIGWIEVDLTTDAKADVARFTVLNAYEWSSSSLDWMDDKIVPGKVLVIKLGYVDKKSQVFEGLITGYTINYSSNGSPTVTVTAMDRSMLMMKTSRSKVWKSVKDSDVVTTIASEYGLTPDIDALTILKDSIEQIGVSDFHLVQSLAQDNDYRFHVTGNKLHFRKQATEGTPIVELKYGFSLIDFTLTVDVTGQASEVKVRGYDTKTKSPVAGSAKSVTVISGSKSGPSLAGALSSRKIETLYTQVSSVEEANHLAGAMLNKLSRDLVRGHGSCIGFPEMMPGKMISISGIGGSKMDRNLMMTRVVHRVDATEGYTIQFEAEGNAL